MLFNHLLCLDLFATLKMIKHALREEEISIVVGGARLTAQSQFTTKHEIFMIIMFDHEISAGL